MNRCLLYNLPDTLLFIFIIFLLQHVTESYQPGMNCSPWTLFCRTALGLTVLRPSSEDLIVSLLNCTLIFPCHFFSSSKQFQTRALPFCRLPASPRFLLIIYSFVLITNKNTKQHQMAGRTLQNSSQYILTF